MLTFFCTKLLVFVTSLVAIFGNIHVRSSQRCKQEYDYIIVGAGTAGSMVASELISNNNEITVLIIEEGIYDRSNPAIIENSWVDLLSDKTIEKFYTSIPEPNLNNRNLFLPRAKVTGGCNSHNGQFYILANENDFSDRWGNIPNWELDDILPIWNEILNINPGFREPDGPEHPWIERFILSSKNLGYTINPNYNDLNNGGTQSGVSPIILQSFENPNYDENILSGINSRQYIRRTSWSDFVEPLLDRSMSNDVDNNSKGSKSARGKYKDRLDILTQTRVDKILLRPVRRYRNHRRKNSNNNNNDNNNIKKAIGVETFNIGSFERVNYYANKEVILCGGTYDTPKILMLSGIGDCNELENINIECKVHIPGIGKNLHDHFSFSINGPKIINITKLELELPKNVFDGRQTFGEYGVVSIAQKGEYLHGMSVINTVDAAAIVGPSEDNNNNNIYFVQVIAIDYQLESVGNITLLDNNPESNPLILHNFLSNEKDIEDAIKLFKIGRQFLYDTNVFDELIESKENELSPGFDVQSDQDILEYIKNNGGAGWHQAGTCKMGENFDNDEMVVVNNKLQVRNIKNLRIADASIMPEVVSANTNQMAMVIGKKAAKIILRDEKR